MEQAVDPATLITDYGVEQRRLIVIGIPTFGMVSVEWHAHLMQLKGPMNRILRHLVVKGREVGVARNVLVSQALAVRTARGERAGWILFIDDDVLVPPLALLRLLEHRRPIVGGLYYTKTDPAQPLLLHGRYEGAALSWRPGALVECWGHGMGCTLIEIGVFEALHRAGHTVESDEACLICQGRGDACPACFGTGHLLRWFHTTREHVVTPSGVPAIVSQTEDLYFLERARACGFQAAVDTGCFCWHWDSDAHQAYPAPQWAEYQARGTITWPLANGSTVTWPGCTPPAGEVAA